MSYIEPLPEWTMVDRCEYRPPGDRRARIVPRTLVSPPGADIESRLQGSGDVMAVIDNAVYVAGHRGHRIPAGHPLAPGYPARPGTRLRQIRCRHRIAPEPARCVDHTERLVERGDAFRQLLQNALTVNATLVGQQQNEEIKSMTEASLAQNEEIKKISSWAAILFAPTLIGTIYGMNFDHMPELGWTLGYPMAVFLMIAMGVVLYVIFKRRHWL
jgi:CorA-like Mg2+ transporter protein